MIFLRLIDSTGRWDKIMNERADTFQYSNDFRSNDCCSFGLYVDTPCTEISPTLFYVRMMILV